MKQNTTLSTIHHRMLHLMLDFYKEHGDEVSAKPNSKVRYCMWLVRIFHWSLCALQISLKKANLSVTDMKTCQSQSQTWTNLALVFNMTMSQFHRVALAENIAYTIFCKAEVSLILWILLLWYQSQIVHIWHDNLAGNHTLVLLSIMLLSLASFCA